MDAIANRIVSAVARGSRFNSTETQNGVKGGEAEQAQRIGMVVDVGNSPLVYGLIPSKLVVFFFRKFEIETCMRIVSDPRLFIFIPILGSQNFDTESIPEV